MSKEDAIGQVKQWLTPILITIIGWFVQNTLSDLKKGQIEASAKIDALMNIKTDVAVNSQRITTVEASVGNLKVDVDDVSDKLFAIIKSYPKLEDEITLDKLKKQSK